MNPVNSGTNGAILARLRQETRAEHEAIEAALDLTGADLTLEGYRLRLGQFHGFYRPVETRLSTLDGWDRCDLNLRERLKLPWLERDLRTLGLASLDGLPVCRDVPDLSDLARGFGCLYVLEGATLGGQLISRHLAGSLGVTAEAGGRFFHGYGERTGTMWREFGASLTVFASEPETQERVIASAIAAFRSLRRWCEGEDLNS